MRSLGIQKRDDYLLTVAMHQTQRGEGGVCAVLIGIVNNNLLGAQNLREISSLFILERVPQLGRRLLAQMIASGFTICVEVPPDFRVPGVWPRLVRSSEDVQGLFQQLDPTIKEALLYPLTLWALPKERERRVLQAVNAFSALNRDHGLFIEALRAGAMRCSIQSSSFTISVNCSHIDDAENIVRRSLADLDIPIDWDV